MDASHSLSTACSCVCVCACAGANFVGLREEEVARRWDINRPILHLCFPSGPDEQLQSLSTDVKRTKKMNNNGKKIHVCTNKSV